MPDSENVAPSLQESTRPSRNRLLLAGIFLLLLLALLARFAWLASKTETGWETVSQQWRDASVGLLIGEHQPLSNLEPVDQAAFWLRETQRVVAEEPNNPNLAMGSALVLDSPGYLFMSRYISGVDSGVGYKVPRFDNKAIARAVDAFEDKCRAQCLAMAAKATELQPKETRWWRLRALTLFVRQFYGSHEEEARTADWLQVLQQCQDHDPDNALYDYLAASHYWKEGVGGRELDMPIVDQAKFDLGMKCFLRGQQKRLYSAGGGEGAILIETLRRTTLPHSDYSTNAGRSMQSRVHLLMKQLWQVPYYQAERLEKKGDLAGSLALRRQSLHVLDQFAPEVKQTSLNYMNLSSIRGSALDSLQTFVEKHPGLVSADEVGRIKVDAAAIKDDERTFADACVRSEAKRTPANKAFIAAIAIVTDAATSTVSLLLFAAAIAGGLAWRLRKTGEADTARLGVFRQTMAWLAAYALSFVVFGMAPAGIIPSFVQNWLFAGSIALIGAAIVCWLGWRIAVRRRLQFSIRFLLGLTLVWAIFLGVLKTCGVLPHDFSDLRMPAMSVPAHGYNNLSADILQQAITTIYGRWYWAMYQWRVYGGHFIGIGVALAIIAAWHWLRSRRIDSTPISPRDRWAGRFAGLGRSMLTAAAVWLIAYSWLMPSVLRFVEDDYQATVARLQNPQEEMSAIAKTMAEIRAEQTWRQK